MKSTVREILLQLGKEFYLPLIVALIWLIINVLFNSNNIKGDTIIYINIFGTGFFFFSFLTGQYNRVKKQLNVEKNLYSVEERLLRLADELDVKTNHLLNNMTGGDSYIDFCIFQDVSSKKRTMTIFNKGDFMMYDISISVSDYSKRSIGIRKIKSEIEARENPTETIEDSERMKNVFFNTTRTFSVGNLPQSSSADLGYYYLDDGQTYIRLETTILARNGSYLCKLFYIDIDTPNEKHAFEILKQGAGKDIVLFRQSHPDFQKTENNEIDWIYHNSVHRSV